GVVQGSDGALYGTGVGGGANNGGALFSITTPPDIVMQPLSETNFVGSTVSFAVLAYGAPTPDYQWQKDGVNLTDDAHRSGCASGTLSLHPLTLSDSGNYAVIATNAFGSATSIVATLTVLLPGTISVKSLTDNTTQLSFTAVPGWQNRLDASSNL